MSSIKEKYLNLTNNEDMSEVDESQEYMLDEIYSV